MVWGGGARGGFTSVDGGVDAGDEAAQGDHGEEVVLEVRALFCTGAGGRFVAVVEVGEGHFFFVTHDTCAWQVEVEVVEVFA